MAKVTGPLMSMSASGTVGGTITFDKRGFVRQRVIPANPQSAPQGNARQILLAVQKALSVLGATPITAVKSIAPVSYRWNSYLLAQVIGPNNATYNAAKAIWDALTAPQRASWDAEAATHGIFEQSVTYADDPAITAGQALFVVSYALFQLGINVVDLVPGAANFDDWGNYFAS